MEGYSTISVVSSIAHVITYPEGIKLSLENLNSVEKYNQGLVYGQAYGQSKLANILFANELAARLLDSKVLVNSIHPGGVYTKTLVSSWGLKSDFAHWLAKKCLFDRDTAALTQVFAAVSPEILSKRITGEYFVPLGVKGATSDFAKNKKLQRDLWTFTENTIKVKGF